MFLQAVPFLQSQLEQVLADYDKLEDFEYRPYIHLCLMTDTLGTFDLMKAGNRIRIMHSRDPNVLCYENPNLVLEILPTGDWIAREMTNSYFIEDNSDENTFELWDTLIRFDRLTDGVLYEVPSEYPERRRAPALAAG